MASGSIVRRVIGGIVGAGVLALAVGAPLASPPDPALDLRFLLFLVGEGIALLVALAFLAPARFQAVDRILAVVIALVVTVGAAASVDSRSTLLGWLGRIAVVLAVGVPALRFALRGDAPRAPAGGEGASEADPAAASLGAVFAEKLAWVLATHPHLAPEGEIAPSGRGRVMFPRSGDDGFDVAVTVRGDEVIVSAGTFADVHFGARGDPAGVAAAAIAFVRDLLGPDSRLRERFSGGEPYLARIEVRTADGWRTAFTTASLYFNYFGRRSERVLVNRRAAAAATGEDAPGTPG